MATHELADAMRLFDDAVQQHDRALAEQVLDEDYALVRVQPSSASMPRARWLELLPDYIVHSWSVEEQQVDRSGDVAAVLSRVHMRATVLGEDRSGLFLISDFWRHREDGWRVWRRHSSPLTAGELPGA
jgi:ketosteroid isomerase-like protein